MSFKIGGSASKTTSTSTRNSQSTTTPIVPEWATGVTQTAAGRIGDLFGHDPYSFVAGIDPLQRQAAQSAASLGQWSIPSQPGVPRTPDDADWLSPYMTANTPFASGGKAYNYVDQYLNPYLNQVVDATAADYDANAGRVRAQQALDLAGSGAFGGSGAAITHSMTEGELARGRATALSGLRSRAFEQALGAAAGDADRATQARISNTQAALQDWAQKTGLGLQAQQQMLAADANRRANVGAQADLGATLRAVEQERLAAPVTSVQQIVAMLSGLPIGLFTGEQKVGSETGTEKTKSVGVNAELTRSLPGQTAGT